MKAIAWAIFCFAIVVTDAANMIVAKSVSYNGEGMAAIFFAFGFACLIVCSLAGSEQKKSQ
jgi:hypothetical protein